MSKEEIASELTIYIEEIKNGLADPYPKPLSPPQLPTPAEERFFGVEKGVDTHLNPIKFKGPYKFDEKSALENAHKLLTTSLADSNGSFQEADSDSALAFRSMVWHRYFDGRIPASWAAESGDMNLIEDLTTAGKNNIQLSSDLIDAIITYPDGVEPKIDTQRLTVNQLAIVMLRPIMDSGVNNSNLNYITQRQKEFGMTPEQIDHAKKLGQSWISTINKGLLTRVPLVDMLLQQSKLGTTYRLLTDTNGDLKYPENAVDQLSDPNYPKPR